MTIDLRLTAPRSTYVAGEDIVVGLEIENRGSSPAQIPDPEVSSSWQPTYELIGPGPNDVARFDFRTAVRGKPPAPLGPSDTAVLDLPPGATHPASLYLSGLVPIERPGQYTLTARLAWGAIDVTSQPLSFSIEPAVTRSFEYGLSIRADGTAEIYTAWLHDGADGTTLFQAGFGEDRPDLGEVGRRSIARICPTAPSASGVLVPWAAHSRLEDLVGWVLWREGNELCGLATMSRGPLRMPLPFAPSLLVMPPLESPAHTVDLFLVGGPSQRTLALVRVVHGGLAKPPQGSVVWTFELPEPVIGAAVAPQPNARDRVRHLALVSAGAGGVTVRHAIADGASPPSKMTEVTLDDWAAHPGTPPAILAHEKGGARVSVLLTSPGDALRCRLAELLFGPPHPSEPAAVSSGVVLPVAPAQGRIHYYRDPVSGAFRRDWAIRGADGGTFTRGPGGTPVLARAASADPPPLALVVLAQSSYLLERSPAGVLGFEHV